MTSADGDVRDETGEGRSSRRRGRDGDTTTDAEDAEDAENAVARFAVPEMDCPSCAGKITKSVRRLDGVVDVDPRVTSGTLVVSYDASLTDPDAVARRVESAGYQVEDADHGTGDSDGTERTTTFSVPSMDCASCAGKVESALDTVSGVSAYETRPTTGRVRVTSDAATPEADVVAAIEGAGYDVTGRTDETDADAGERDGVLTTPQALKTWGSGVFVVVGLLLEFLVPAANAPLATLARSELVVADVLFLAAVAVGGQEILRNGYYSARQRSLDIDFLMSIAILGAITASLVFGDALYFEAATLAVLFSVAELLERASMNRARDSLAELMDLSPDEATVRRDTGSSETPRADGEAVDGETVPALQAEGKTVVLVGRVADAVDPADADTAEIEGVIAVADDVRPDAARTIARLKELGVERTVMLTGDNARTAGAIADRVGVDDYRAELLPEEKVAAVEELMAEHDGVAMVGDGINDAPALATATVGVAMGAAGTDTALETADIALMADDLSKLPYLYELAADANGVIRQNVAASLAVKAALALAVPFGYVPIWLAVLAGDAGMTVGVTGNAMRLSQLRPEVDAADDTATRTASPTAADA